MKKMKIIQIGSKRSVVSIYYVDTQETEFLLVNNDYINFLKEWVNML